MERYLRYFKAYVWLNYVITWYSKIIYNIEINARQYLWGFIEE